MAIQLGAIPAAAALALAKSAAKHAGVPISKLTKRMIQNAPIPVRWKKLFQPKNTPGESQIANAVKSSRTMAKGEAKFGLASLGIGITAGVAGTVLAYAKDKEKEKNKAQPNVRVGVKTGATKKGKTGTGDKGRNKARTPLNRALDSAGKAVNNPPKKKVVKPKPKPKKPFPKVRPRVRPGS